MSMTIKELKRAIENYPDDMQIVIGSDEELNQINGVGDVYATQLEKSNNTGSFDALMLQPNNQSFEQYFDEDFDE